MRRIAYSPLPMFRLALHNPTRENRALVYIPLPVVQELSESADALEPLARSTYDEIDLAPLTSNTTVYLWADPEHLPLSTSLFAQECVTGIIVAGNSLNNPEFADEVAAAVEAGTNLIVAFADPATLAPQFAQAAEGFVVNPFEVAAEADPTKTIVWAVGLNSPAEAAAGLPYIGTVHEAVKVASADFAPGELQCMRALQLLSDPNASLAEVADILGLDPVISVRALHLANSAAFGVPNKLDSLQTAVAFLGMQRVSTLLMTSLISSRQPRPDALWFLLTRAETCRSLSCDPEAAYTTGLLSALADETGGDPAALAEQTGVSDLVRAAFEAEESDLGELLAAVKAYETGNVAKIAATGWNAEDIAMAYLDALPQTRDSLEHLTHAAQLR